MLDIKVGTISVNIPDFFYWTTNDVIGGFVDSGTSVYLVAPAIFQSIQNIFQSSFGHLPGVSNILFSGGCVPSSQMGNKLSEFPLIFTQFPNMAGGTFTLSMPPESYLMLVNNSYCLGIVGNAGTGIVLGDVFMENYYIAFDKAKGRVGFAPLKKCL